MDSASRNLERLHDNLDALLKSKEELEKDLRERTGKPRMFYDESSTDFSRRRKSDA